MRIVQDRISLRDVKLSLEEIDAVIEEATERYGEEKTALGLSEYIKLKIKFYAVKVARETFVVEG